MQVFGHDCGCDTRKSIMFTDGRPGVSELVIITLAASAIIIAYKIGRR